MLAQFIIIAGCMLAIHITFNVTYHILETNKSIREWKKSIRK